MNNDISRAFVWLNKNTPAGSQFEAYIPGQGILIFSHELSDIIIPSKEELDAKFKNREDV